MELHKLRPGPLCCVRYVVFAHHNFRHISDPEQETRCTLSLGINQAFFGRLAAFLVFQVCVLRVMIGLEVQDLYIRSPSGHFFLCG